ncbi:MAG TPA: hypothetical protein VMT71_08420 [Syntrophorhabdales bacterium]|nr:hypothetical protein [Syntrophorhabdales bacterium]
MRFFFLHDYQDWLLSVFLGIVLAILVYLAFRSYGYASRRAGEKAEEVYPDGIIGKNFPTTPFILFLYIGFVVWAIIYVIYIGIKGGPI